MELFSLLGFIKFAFAGTGTARDINSLIILMIIFLVLLLAITYLISKIRKYLLNRQQNGDNEGDSFPKDFEVYDDFDYF